MIHSTTIVSIRRNGRVAIGSDGQVTMGKTIVKGDAKKIRVLGEGKTLVGFAGATADAFALLERFEGMLTANQGNVRKSALELAKEWRTDRFLRRLQSLLAVVDREASLVISGSGDVLEPPDSIVAIGSGGPYALAAARALLRNTQMSAAEIVREALTITASICIYTNDFFTIEELRT